MNPKITDNKSNGEEGNESGEVSFFICLERQKKMNRAENMYTYIPGFCWLLPV